jgi:hypothetical protein
MMKSTKIAIMTICLLCLMGASVLTSEAATTFAGAIVGVDQAQRTITLQTRDGQTWILPVADPNLLTKDPVAKGDLVSIEIDLSERITKITKLSQGPQSEHIQPRDDIRP